MKRSAIVKIRLPFERESAHKCERCEVREYEAVKSEATRNCPRARAHAYFVLLRPENADARRRKLTQFFYC